MENQATPQPRDSRLEQFVTTARNIIMIERGLTSTAMVKIRYLAKRQQLSNDQVESCLSQISGGNSSLGRVGRYEQLFLDRLATDLPAISNAEASGVLPPTIQRQAIQIAIDEFQIKETRANQLLSFSAKQHGLRQVSASDAKAKLRDWIADRLDSREFQSADLRGQISGLAERFGINDTEVDELIDAEMTARQKQQSQTKRWLFCGVLVAASVAVAGVFLGPALLSPSSSLKPDATKISEDTAIRNLISFLPTQSPKTSKLWQIRERSESRISRKIQSSKLTISRIFNCHWMMAP